MVNTWVGVKKKSHFLRFLVPSKENIIIIYYGVCNYRNEAYDKNSVNDWMDQG